MAQLENKIALIAGASSGIGRAIALSLAAEGASVVLAARRKAELNSVAVQIRNFGGHALPVPTDLTVETQVISLFQLIQQTYSCLDILINSIGSFGSAPIEAMSVEVWDRVINSNLKAPFLCIREALKIMKKQRRGRIINIGSTSAKRVRSNSAAYSAAKHGLWGLTQVTALEGRSFGITCCCVHPGRVRVERASSNPGSKKDPFMSVDDIARTVLHIATLPSDVLMLETTILPIEQPYIGRG
jgi:NAD(P)-dependent dehydrogenase (short-subunit alcohol dehydrogenase family)